jgi:uncharacterized protein DUF5330
VCKLNEAVTSFVGDHRDVMFFLLRVAFWLSIVVILLPTDPAKKNDSVQAAVSSIEALGAAHAAFEDARGFCDRKPEACQIGSQAIQTFGQKAQLGSKYLYEFLSDRFGENGHTDKVTGSITEHPGRQTLMAADFAPAWHAPQAIEHRTVPLPPRRPL